MSRSRLVPLAPGATTLVVVAKDDCTSCGLCSETHARYFRMDDDDLAESHNGGINANAAMVTEADRASVQKAIDACPGECIHWKLPATNPASPLATNGTSAAHASAADTRLAGLHRSFDAEIREIDEHLVKYLDRFDGDGQHYGMMQYLFGFADQELRPLSPDGYLSRGKRLRPILCMLICRMMALPPDLATTVMMACEVMHGASLAHDDIEDRDAVRWGRPTLNSLFGMEQAINAGDAMIGLVYQLLLGLRAQGVRDAAIVDVVDVFNRTHLRMCEGQHLDLSYKCHQAIEIDAYLDMIRRKTASPCVCIADAISILAGCPVETRDALSQFGESLGMLYQICDDIRGIWSETRALGRQAGHDVCLQRATLPLLYAFKLGSPELRARILEKKDAEADLAPDELAAIRHELEACGAIGRCYDHAADYYRRALTALQRLPAGRPEIEVLRSILASCVASIGLAV